MSHALPLHLALFLVPYVTPTDIARAQRVCKHWQAVFSSHTLLQTALRIHFPFSQEVRARSSSSASSALTTFNLVSRRYAALKSGTPQQELRVPISRTRRDIYVWTFAENLLVYQSRHYPTAVLSLIYLDYSASQRRIRTGTITLDIRGEQVIRVKVCRDVLIVECTDERVTTPGRTNFFATAECYRLQLSGQDEVSAERMSVINTFEFAYIDYSHQILSDNSGMYYAAYSKYSVGFDGVIGVWEVETGQEVKRISRAALEGMGLMTDLLVIQNQNGQHQVVMIGNDRRNNNARRWNRFPGEWGYLSNFRVFTVEGDEHESEQQLRGFVGRTKAECPRGSNLLTTTFKVPRLPGGLEHSEGREEEEAALVLWELDDNSNQATAFYYTIPGDSNKYTGRESEVAIQANAKYRIPPTTSTREPGQRPAPFSVQTRDALSFTMDFTGRNEDFEDTRLMLYHLRIQGFYPSQSSPDEMNLEWETCLKDLGSKKEHGQKNDRGIYSATRNVTYLNAYGMEVAGDERAIVYLELKEGGMDLVVVVWDEPFNIPAGVENLDTCMYYGKPREGEERLSYDTTIE